MGNKFRFKLNGLLKLREFKEKQLKVELGQIVKKIQEIKNKISFYQDHLSEAYRGQELLLEGESKAEMLKFFPYFVEGKNAAIKQEESKIQILEKKYEEKVQQMISARGETKVIDKLKEKEYKAFRKEKTKKDFEKIEDLRIIRQGMNYEH